MRARCRIKDVFRTAAHTSSRIPGGRVIFHVGGICVSMQKERAKSSAASAIYQPRQERARPA